MSKFIFILSLFLYAFTYQVNAQGHLNTGLFVNQNPNTSYFDEHSSLSADKDKNFLMGFQSNVKEGAYNISLSLKYGRFIFGFESLSDLNRSLGQNTSYSDTSGHLSAETSSSVLGGSNRALLGVMLPNNVAVYGFQGVSSHVTHSSLSYYNEHTFEKCVKVNRRCHYTEVSHITEGYHAGDFENLAHSFGAGMETLLLGGVFRLEYGFTHRPGYKQSVKLDNWSTVKDVPFTDGMESADFQWAANIYHSVNFRWRTTF